MKVLHLTLKKKWFDMIHEGVKLEEYRENKPYWQKRLVGKDYDVISFTNGYSRTSRQMTVKLLSVGMDKGKPQWGYTDGFFNLKLGTILSTTNF